MKDGRSNPAVFFWKKETAKPRIGEEEKLKIKQKTHGSLTEQRKQ